MKKNKKGFTLVEVMLSIAIVIIISGLFVALVYAIKDSYNRVYNTDDSIDYAQLQAQALENQMLKNSQVDVATGSKFTYSLGYESRLLVNNSPVFTIPQMRNKDGVCKWGVYIDKLNTYFDDETNIFYQNFIFVDGQDQQFGNPGVIRLEQKGSFYIPHARNGEYKILDDGSVTAHYKNGTARQIQNCKIEYTAK